jgi:hypothetical protein
VSRAPRLPTGARKDPHEDWRAAAAHYNAEVRHRFHLHGIEGDPLAPEPRELAGLTVDHVPATVADPRCLAIAHRVAQATPRFLPGNIIDGRLQIAGLPRYWHERAISGGVLVLVANPYSPRPRRGKLEPNEIARRYADEWRHIVGQQHEDSLSWLFEPKGEVPAATIAEVAFVFGYSEAAIRRWAADRRHKNPCGDFLAVTSPREKLARAR